MWVPAPWRGDAMFDAEHAINRDDLFSGFRLFRSAVEALGGEVHTHDVYLERGQSPDVVIFHDVPRGPVSRIMRPWPNAERWLIAYECEALIPRNFSRTRHRSFSRIFTWHDDLVDDRRYFKLNFSNPLPGRMAHRELERPHHATMIVGNKKAFDRRELYSERERVIRWYEEHAPEDFEFWGVGWDRYTFGGPMLTRGLNLVGPLRSRMPVRDYPSWRGLAGSKWETFAQYRFAYCYENARDIPGYITEKIFDAMIAGSIPVYWGAPNVTDYIPAAAFVDRRQFGTQAELAAHLRTLDADPPARQAMLDAMDEFLTGPIAAQWSDHAYAAILGRHVGALATAGGSTRST